MDRHSAKCEALKKCSNELRKAISADVDNLSFQLYAEGLIPQEVRDSKEAGKIVSSLESRLVSDESAWEKLIKVLQRFKGCASLVKKLKEQLAAEMSGQDAQGDNAPERQQQDRSG